MSSRTISNSVVYLFLFALVALVSSTGLAVEITLFEDTFDLGDPSPADPNSGSNWQPHGADLPHSINIGGTVFVSALNMLSFPVATETRGVETVSPISLAELTNVTVNARVKPENQGSNATRASIELALLGSSGEWIQTSATGNVFTRGADFNGDFVPPDNDRGVDGDDLPLWEAGYGTTTGAILSDGDSDEDGDVDGIDFLNWQWQFGCGVQPEGSPENCFPDRIDDWADIYADSTRNYRHSGHFNLTEDTPDDPSMYRRYKITVDTEGTTLEIFRDDELPAINLSYIRWNSPTIADLGADLTIAFRQDIVLGKDSVQGFVDEVFVTTDDEYVAPAAAHASAVVPEPSSLLLVFALFLSSGLGKRKLCRSKYGFGGPE